MFDTPEGVQVVSERLRDRAAIARARVFPYQLLAAFRAADARVPSAVRMALHDALEIAIDNVPCFPGKVWLLLDVSGSMHAPVTGHRRGATSAVRCVDVAALIASSVLRRNPEAEVLPFADDVIRTSVNPRDSVLTNARLLASLPSGGTNCSAPLCWLNQRRAAGDLVIYVSDQESWVDSAGRGTWGDGPTPTLREWARFKRRNRNARLVCIDLQPYATTQASDRQDILNVGGFSDQVFEVIRDFAAGGLAAGHWVAAIAAVEL